MNITIITVDTDYTRTLLNTKLEEQKHTVVAGANNYDDALELYKTYIPDIIILDIDLVSTNNGLAFINQLLELDPSAQIIALSSLFRDSTKARLFKKGIDRLVMKPYQPAHIWEQIDNIRETKDILMLREEREFIINENASYSTSKGNQINNQILSLRDQISQKRKKTDEDLELNHQSSYKSGERTENQETDDIFLIEDFSLDVMPTQEINTSNSNISKDLIEGYKTGISDNSNKPDISLHESSLNDFEFNLNNQNRDTYKESNYLGLPLFIDREQRADDIHDEVTNNENLSSHKQNSNQFNLLQKILHKKGGK